jgi:SAM-dependent methyltransferase
MAHTGVGEIPASSRLGYNKLCELEDFSHPDLRPVIRTVFAHEIDRFGPDFPAGREYRKHWEVAMAVRTLRDFGVLDERAEILGVGAGNEPTIFCLTNKVRRVFATDLYGGSGVWAESSHPSMLTDPGVHWPAAWNRRRLVVQHMNALDLAYEDESFDGIFSSSSIEHFGTLDDVGRASREMFRVLRPGGVLSLSTEFRLEGPSPGLPGVLMFDVRQVEERVIGDLPWAPVSPLAPNVSEATRRRHVEFRRALADLRGHVSRHGHICFHRLDWSCYPHIVLREGAHIWTSVHIALRKLP